MGGRDNVRAVRSVRSSTASTAFHLCGAPTASYDMRTLGHEVLLGKTMLPCDEVRMTRACIAAVCLHTEPDACTGIPKLTPIVIMILRQNSDF